MQQKPISSGPRPYRHHRRRSLPFRSFGSVTAAVAVTTLFLGNGTAQAQSPGTGTRDKMAAGRALRGSGTLSAAEFQRAVQQRDRMPSMVLRGADGTSSAQVSGVPLVPLRAGAAGIGTNGTNGTRVNIGQSTNKWVPLGPYNRAPPDIFGSAGVYGPLPITGRVNGVATANDSTGIFYLATASGGVWKYDPGNYDRLNAAYEGPWSHYSDTLFPTLYTSSVAVDPSDHRIVYIGLGDYDGNLSGGNSLGIMKSVNGGGTWYNIGNGQAGVPAGGAPRPVIMEGTCVSAILINPANTNRLVASSGRGVNAGGLWFSNDKGTTWTRATLAGGTNPVPFGNWSALDYGVPATGSTIAPCYATLENGGVYRSADFGATWTKLPVPLVYNGRTPSLTGPFGLKVAASKVDTSIVYVVDSARNYSDGKIFKSVDSGQTWSDITGNYPTSPNNDNTWSVSEYALNLTAIQTPVTTLDANGNQVAPGTRLIETLYGGTRTLAGSVGGYKDNNGTIYSVNPNGPTVDVANDLGATQDWFDIGQIFGINPQTHLDIHGVAVDKGSLLNAIRNRFNPSQQILSYVVNDGGVYQNLIDGGIFQPDAFGGLPFFYPPTWTMSGASPIFGNTPASLNNLLVVGQFVSSDFVQNGSGAAIRVLGTTYANAVTSSDDVQFTATPVGTAPTRPTWSSFNALIDIRYSSFPSFALVSDAPDNRNNPNIIPPAPAFPWIYPYLYMDTVAFDTNDQTGNTQYVVAPIRNGIFNWPSYRIYYTINSFAPGGNGVLDITPDRFLLGTGGGANPGDGTVGLSSMALRARDKNGKQPLYIYNTVDPGDSTPSNWQGEKRADVNLPITFGGAVTVEQNAYIGTPSTKTRINDTGSIKSVMYTGGQYLWRFDAPGNATYPSQPGPAPAMGPPTIAPNRDRGNWRRVGGTALASGNDYITAIATNPITPVLTAQATTTIYVGTSSGAVWRTRNAGAHDTASQAAPLTATWVQIAGPGSGNTTLPTRPVTSISINSDPLQASFGDIVVALGGAPNAGTDVLTGQPTVGRLYRATNTLGNNNPVFVNASGTTSSSSFAYLPDVPVNAVTRDPGDPTNTLFVATDLGVFSSTDAGSTWANATGPLGLPNAECTNIKIVPEVGTSTGPYKLMVSTYGRGVWGFDLSSLSATNAPPNLSVSPTFSRSGNEIVANLEIRNLNQANGTQSGTAYNVQVQRVTIQVPGSTALPAYTVPQTPTTQVTTATPVQVGTLAPPDPNTGQTTSQFVTVRFDGSTIRAGSSVTFAVQLGYTAPPIPPGTKKIVTPPTQRVRIP